MSVVVANVTILTDFVILDIPKDDSMFIILGRPFLNTAGAVIDCTKGNVTFHVNGNEHTVHFPRKQPQVYSISSIGKFSSIIFGGFEFPLPTVKKKYNILITPLRKHSVIRNFSSSMLFGMSSLTRLDQPC